MMERGGMSVFICELRKEKNMTQKQLAEVLGLTDKAVSKWERGQGYPDIATLPKLSETLGVTVGELLDGKRAEVPAPQSEELVENAMRYAQRLTTAKHKNIGIRVMLIVSCLFIAAAFTCVVCDVAIFKGLTWSLYPLVSMAFVWLTLLPVCLLHNHKLEGGLAVASVLVLPLLFCLERIGNGTRWFWALGVPLAVASLVYLWAVWALFCKSRLSVWFAGALMLSLSFPLDLLISFIAERFAGGFSLGLDDIIQCVATAAMALLLFAAGCFLRKKN